MWLPEYKFMGKTCQGELGNSPAPCLLRSNKWLLFFSDYFLIQFVYHFLMLVYCAAQKRFSERVQINQWRKIEEKNQPLMNGLQKTKQKSHKPIYKNSYA